MPDRAKRKQIAHVFAGVTRAGAASRRPYEEKAKAKNPIQAKATTNADPSPLKRLRDDSVRKTEKQNRAQSWAGRPKFKARDILMTRRHVNERGKTRRAYAAHLDLLDTADWWRALMSAQLGRLGVRMKAFRVLERLYRRGGMYQLELSRSFLCRRQSIAEEIRYLERWGWVRRVRRRLAPLDPTVSRRGAAALISEKVLG